MAKILNTNQEVSIKKNEAINSAARFVLSFASLNEKNKEEDFFELFSEQLICRGNMNENRELVLSGEEREWMRKEFETIANIIRARIVRRH